MNSKSDIRWFAVAFFLIAIAMRLMPHAYNVAAVGALGMFVGCMWSMRIGLLMTMAAMGISDVLGHLLGVPSVQFYSIQLMVLVYVSMALSSVVGAGLRGLNSQWSFPLLPGVPFAAVASTGVFFLLSNFGSWLDPMMSFPQTVEGLLACYAAALPFVQNTLIGNLVFSVIFFGSYFVAAGRVRSALAAEVVVAR